MSNNQRKQRNKASSMVIGIMGIGVLGYIVGPPLYWHLSDLLESSLPSSASASKHRCYPCFCDCSSQPLLSLSDDCMKHDPEVSEEMEKTFTQLLGEEVRLKEAEALDNHHRADVSLLEAKKMASQYQKDADKCTAGMETCEAARERAQAALDAQKKLSATWELRARRSGWREGITKSNNI